MINSDINIHFFLIYLSLWLQVDYYYACGAYSIFIYVFMRSNATKAFGFKRQPNCLFLSFYRPVFRIACIIAGQRE